MFAIVSAVFGIIEIGVGLRFLLELFGANPDNSFVLWVYNLTAPLVAPFEVLFGHVNQAVAGALPHSVFEPAALVALVVYGVIGGILLKVTSR